MLTHRLLSITVLQLLKPLVKNWLLQPRGNIRRTRWHLQTLLGHMFRLPHEVMTYDGRIAGVPVKWLHNDRSAEDLLVLYLHGGGFVFPALRPHFTLAAYFAQHTQAKVLLPDYRLAPEHPFPAAYEDCLGTYRWLITQGGYSAEKIILMGDSAGANLALATAIGARREGLPQPAGIVMFSPPLSFDANLQSRERNKRSESLLSEESLEYFANSYAPPGTDLHDECLAPLHADFSGLAPMRFYVSDTEMLFDDSQVAAEKARDEGVDVELILGKKMPHAWPLLHFLPEARSARHHVTHFINHRWRHLRNKRGTPASA